MTIEELEIIVKASIGDVESKFKQAAQATDKLTDSSERMSSKFGGNVAKMQKHLDSLNKSFEKIQAQVAEKQNKIAELYAKQDEIIYKYRDLPAFSGMNNEGGLSKLVESDAGFAKLGKEIEKLESQMGPLVSKGKQTQDAIKNVGKSMQESSAFGGQLNKAFDGLLSKFTLVGLATKGVELLIQAVKKAVAAIKEAVKAYSDAENAQRAFLNVTGAMSDELTAWSNHLENILGLNARMLREDVSLLYQMATQMGFTEKSAYQLSTGLTELAYNLAAARNTSPDEAFTAVQSAMSGSGEGLKKYGVILNENIVKVSAYANGLAKTGQELSQQQKMYAAYLAIMQQTQNVQNYIKSNMDTLAAQTRVYNTELTRLQLNLGRAFAPIQQTVLPALNALISKMADALEYVAIFSEVLFGIQKRHTAQALSASKAAIAESKLGESLARAGKNAKKGIAAFDELNLLQEAVGVNGGSVGDISVPTAITQFDDLADKEKSLDSFRDKVEKLKETVNGMPSFVKNLALDGFVSTVFGPVGSAFTQIRHGVGAVSDLAKTLKEPAFKSDDLFSGLSESTQEAMGSFQELYEETDRNLKLLQWSGKTVTAEIRDTITGNFAEMGSQIVTRLEQDRDESLKVIGEMVKNSTTLSEQEKAEILKTVTGTYDEKITAVKEGVAKIDEIYKKAASENRAITYDESVEIGKIQKQMWDSAVLTFTESKEEQRSILEKMKANAEKISAEQAAAIVKASLDQKEKAIENANAEYEERVKYAELLRAKGGEESEKLADKVIQDAARQRDEAIAKAREMHSMVIAEAQKQAGEYVGWIDWTSGRVKGSAEKMWSDVKTAFTVGGLVLQKAWRDSLDKLSEDYQQFATRFKQGWESFWSGVGDGLKMWIVEPTREAFNSIIRLVNSIKIPEINIPGIGKIGGIGFNIPEIPKFARGAIVDANNPMMAIVGDNPTQREVISPLGDLTNIIAGAVRSAVESAMKTQGSSGEQTIILKLGETELARAVVKTIKDYQRQTGQPLMTF
jgi:hypothetical protein